MSCVLVLGCADLIVPGSAWAERKADLLTLRCNASQETWYLTCKGRRWVGTMANCSTGKTCSAMFCGVLPVEYPYDTVRRVGSNHCLVCMYSMHI